MSKISLSGDASGTGTLTIAAPNTNSNYTLTLPTNTGTVMTSASDTFSGGLTLGGDLTLDSNGIYLGGTGAANYLDDYEEGTFTPVLSGGGTPGTYELTTANGTYTKIGRLVYVSCSITLSSSITGGGSSYAKISGLPFNYDVSEDTALTGHLRTTGVNYNSSATQINVVRESGGDSDVVAFSETFPNAAAQFIQIADFAASDSLNFTLVYHTT